jgi:hypothetical protein
VEIIDPSHLTLRSVKETALGSHRAVAGSDKPANSIEFRDVISCHPLPNGDCVAVSSNGAVSVFQADSISIQAELQSWKQMIGWRDEQASMVLLCRLQVILAFDALMSDVIAASHSEHS